MSANSQEHAAPSESIPLLKIRRKSLGISQKLAWIGSSFQLSEHYRDCSAPLRPSLRIPPDRAEFSCLIFCPSYFNHNCQLWGLPFSSRQVLGYISYLPLSTVAILFVLLEGNVLHFRVTSFLYHQPFHLPKVSFIRISLLHVKIYHQIRSTSSLYGNAAGN